MSNTESGFSRLKSIDQLRLRLSRKIMHLYGSQNAFCKENGITDRTKLWRHLTHPPRSSNAVYLFDLAQMLDVDIGVRDTKRKKKNRP